MYVCICTVWILKLLTMCPQSIRYEVWNTVRGLKVYSMRSESIQYQNMRFESIHYEAWMYAARGLKVYSMRPEFLHYEAWKYTLWSLKIYTMRFESIQYRFWGLNVYSMRPESIHCGSWMCTVWGLKAYSNTEHEAITSYDRLTMWAHCLCQWGVPKGNNWRIDDGFK